MVRRGEIEDVSQKKGDIKGRGDENERDLSKNVRNRRSAAAKL